MRVDSGHAELVAMGLEFLEAGGVGYSSFVAMGAGVRGDSG